MKQLTKEEQLIGKTIEKVIFKNGDIHLKFTDGTFCYFATDSDPEDVWLSSAPINPTDPILTLGVLTEEERMEIIDDGITKRNQKEHWLERKKARQIRMCNARKNLEI